MVTDIPRSARPERADDYFCPTVKIQILSAPKQMAATAGPDLMATSDGGKIDTHRNRPIVIDPVSMPKLKGKSLIAVSVGDVSNHCGFPPNFVNLSGCHQCGHLSCLRICLTFSD